ncbi:MAG: LacI family DNA-binding transcriptional regulator [Victivallaceae bacterium]
MENNRKTTVKDIALRCNVSRALAGAVLSNTKNNIRFSEAKRDEVLKVARELNYRPNRIAQAMKTGIVPLVALCVHVEKSYQEEINLYLNDLLPNTSYKLQENGFEMIFVPYDNADELKARVKHLAEDNLTNGIITNFPPENGNDIAEYLKKIGLPFVMLGTVHNPATPCINIDTSELYKKLYEYGQDNGFKRTIWLITKRNIHGGIDWTPDLLTPSPEKRRIDDFSLDDPDTLWAAAGEFTRRVLIREKGVSEKNIISVENKRIMIQAKPSVYVRSKDSLRATIAADMLVKWITDGKMPEPKKIKLAPEDIEFIL